MTPLLLPAPRELHLHEHPPIPVPRPVRTHGIAAHDQYRVLTQVVPCQAAETKDAAWLRVQVVADGRAEHYHLTIAAHGVDLRASDQAGVRAGLTTLAQLIHQFGSTLPCLEIDHFPPGDHHGVFSVLGLMAAGVSAR